MNSRERELKTKREATDDDPNYTKFPKITASSRQWSNHKNPRIVRVSRTFGGKDRHSKVSTVRGLRDRRIRLSVPTAIHLYDLQDRLGLGQPSKVVDWLLDATKHEIEKLPPLPMLPPNFTHQAPPNHPSSLSHFQSPKNLGLINPAKEEIVQENQEGFGGFVSSQSLFPSPFPNMPYTNPYFQNWDPPNLSLSHIGGGYPMNNQSEDQSHHYFYPSATTIPSIIPSYISPLMETDWRNLQNPLVPTTLQLISSPMKPFTLNANSNKSVYFQQSYNEKRDKDERS